MLDIYVTSRALDILEQPGCQADITGGGTLMEVGGEPSICDVDLSVEGDATTDVNELIASHWQGPTETALYFYGPSAQRMRESMGDVLTTYPLHPVLPDRANHSSRAG